MEKKQSGGFSGSLGFVFAAAGSAVGVGNIWRFPYLAAQDGGGVFILVYLALVLTFGFTLLTTDIAIGRKTGRSALSAFGAIRPKWDFLGKMTFLVPTLIMTYYTVIGGWVTKYVAVYLTGSGADAARDGYFVGFITSPVGSIAFMLLFLAVTAVVVYCGVEKGIEKFSSIVMPLISQLTCVFIGWVLNPRWIAEEMELGGCRFGRKKLYGVMIRYIAPVIMAVLFVQSMGLLS